MDVEEGDGEQERVVVVQAGAYGENMITNVEEAAGRTTSVDGRSFRVRLAPGSGGKLTLRMKRFAASPTFALPYE